MSGHRGKAAQTEGDLIDDRVNLTSLSMVTPAKIAPSHNCVPSGGIRDCGFQGIRPGK
jgi:hypothetical protein